MRSSQLFMILPYVFCFLGAAIFLLSVYFTIAAIGFRRSNTLKTKGFLERRNIKRNVFIGIVGTGSGRCVRPRSGRWVKNWVDYTYTYRVNDKKYSISGGIPGKPDSIFTTVTVVYQKKRPKLSYISELMFPIQPVLAVILFIISSIFLIPGIILLIS